MLRLLDCKASNFAQMNGQQLKQSIRASEGRVLLAEVICSVQPLLSVSNAEMVSAFGADMILLNLFDVFDPKISGLDVDDPKEVIRQLKQYIGRPVGVNLEPVDPHAEQAEKLDTLPVGRTATEETFREAKNLGFDFICLTGNPKTGVTNPEIIRAISGARKVMGEDILIIAGKMHAAGVVGEAGADIIKEQDLVSFIEAGADVILLPSPGTVPGITLENSQRLVQTVHKHGALTILATGTSQEGADEATIRQIALYSKMAGTDMYHIGDAGYTGIAIPENIMQYSIVIRGKRHTYVRMASSVLR
ncbi:haloacid dehalogenase-like hydrolase [Brevibacillus sp. SYSU BS000544]|uniref:DUF7916 family protein n=1 Tax=Brevibacillus sp. SYSU BS000544 TaxID=3416443 RepID=UPI003CE50CCC